MFCAKLFFQDGAVIELPVAEGQTVAEAALERDAPLRSDCMSGNCGSCIARCSEGDVTAETTDNPIVSPDEMVAGIYPTCLTRLRGDARFELDYPLEPRPSPSSRHKGELITIERVAATVSRLTIRLNNPETFHFQPGQYLRLRPPGLRVARAYSIASAPRQLPTIELIIRHVAGGQVSGWLESNPAPGARLTIQGPLGGFALDKRADRAVFVAGGTGLAPALSMIRDRAGCKMPMTLCFGCTRREDLFLYDELHALAAVTPNFTVRIALMEGASGDIYRGTAVALLAGQPVDGVSYHLCGPPGMVNAARATLRVEGVAAHQIRAERFAVGA